MSEDGVRASVGFFSDTGPRPDNQDFAAALFGWELQPPRHDAIAPTRALAYAQWR